LIESREALGHVTQIGVFFEPAPASGRVAGLQEGDVLVEQLAQLLFIDVF
jgi:hypothetical protein